MKAVVAAFNQEKALVGAFSVIVQPVVEPMDRFAALIITELSQIASMTYFVEKEASHWTFIDSFWYSLMTLTTVGNESQPNSMSGKVSSIIYTYLCTHNVCMFYSWWAVCAPSWVSSFLPCPCRS